MSDREVQVIAQAAQNSRNCMEILMGSEGMSSSKSKGYDTEKAEKLVANYRRKFEKFILLACLAWAEHIGVKKEYTDREVFDYVSTLNFKFKQTKRNEL